MDFKNPLDLWVLDKAIRNSNNDGPDGCSYMVVGLLALLPVFMEFGFLCRIIYNTVERSTGFDLVNGFDGCVIVFMVGMIALYFGGHYLALRRKGLRIGLYVFFFLFWGIFSIPLAQHTYHFIIDYWGMPDSVLSAFFLSFGFAALTLGVRYFYLGSLRERFVK